MMWCLLCKVWIPTLVSKQGLRGSVHTSAPVNISPHVLTSWRNSLAGASPFYENETLPIHGVISIPAYIGLKGTDSALLTHYIFKSIVNCFVLKITWWKTYMCSLTKAFIVYFLVFKDSIGFSCNPVQWIL
jgi:hypothetical protein